MDSQQLKLSVIRNFLFDRKYVWAFTESFNQADVLAVNGKMFSHEIEIKISKEDFTKEAKAIEFLTGKDTNMRRARGANKLSKHATYLKHSQYKYGSSYFVPNYFSFAIPIGFEEFAKRVLEGTPYGLYLFVNGIPDVLLKPQLLIEGPTITTKDLPRLTRKACTENYFLRRKLWELNQDSPIDKVL